MTANQIAYQKALEDMRHNREDENIRARTASSQEQQAEASLRQAAVAEKKAPSEVIKMKTEAIKNITSNIGSMFDIVKGSLGLGDQVGAAKVLASVLA